LKTAVSLSIRDQRDANGDLAETIRADIAASFQRAVVETLSTKSLRALRETGLKTLVLAGGVSANTELRALLESELSTIGAKVFYARPRFCTDNGAMIAYAGCQRLLAGEHEDLPLRVRARWPLTELSAVGAR